MSDVIELACAGSANYLRHMGAMLDSALTHTRRRPLRVTTLHDEPPPEEEVARLRTVVEGHDAELLTIIVPPELMEGFPRTRHFPPVVFARTLLPALRPDIDRILYLDSDLIVVDDLTPLWETDLEGHLFGAVTNPCYPGMPPPKVVGLRNPHGYLNSGVLLLDLARMRFEGCIDELRSFATANPELPCADQDALAALYHDRHLRLHPRWNVQAICYERPAHRLPFPPGQAADALARPAVVHFTATAKPWHYMSRHPLRHLYFEHLDRTPWPRVPLQGGGRVHRILRPLPTPVQFILAGPLGRAKRAWTRLRTRAARIRGEQT